MCVAMLLHQCPLIHTVEAQEPFCGHACRPRHDIPAALLHHVVFRVCTGVPITPDAQQAIHTHATFDSLMKPFQSYIPTTIEMLPIAVKHCIKHDRECRTIADNALNLAMCELSMDTQEKYMGLVLRLVQQVQLGALDASVVATSMLDRA